MFIAIFILNDCGRYWVKYWDSCSDTNKQQFDFYSLLETTIPYTINSNSDYSIVNTDLSLLFEHTLISFTLYSGFDTLPTVQNLQVLKMYVCVAFCLSVRCMYIYVGKVFGVLLLFFVSIPNIFLLCNQIDY